MEEENSEEDPEEGLLYEDELEEDPMKEESPEQDPKEEPLEEEDPEKDLKEDSVEEEPKPEGTCSKREKYSRMCRCTCRMDSPKQ